MTGWHKGFLYKVAKERKQRSGAVSLCFALDINNYFKKQKTAGEAHTHIEDTTSSDIVQAAPNVSVSKEVENIQVPENMQISRTPQLKIPRPLPVLYNLNARKSWV